MTELVVRHIDFRFDDSIPFHWNPGNPYWGNLVNFITLMAPPFERYAIRATRAALPRIHDQAVKEDAELFCRQEAQHARHHRAHMTLLTRKHPGLEGVLNDINASFEAMYRRESLDYHLAYVATVELCFGPLASFVIENREALFIDADPHIAGFMLWHLVEELEHRNSAIDIYRDVVGSHAYRLKTLAKTGRQLNEVGRIAREGFQPACASRSGWGGGGRRAGPVQFDSPAATTGSAVSTGGYAPALPPARPPAPAAVGGPVVYRSGGGDGHDPLLSTGPISTVTDAPGRTQLVFEEPW